MYDAIFYIQCFSFSITCQYESKLIVVRVRFHHTLWSFYWSRVCLPQHCRFHSFLHFAPLHLREH